MKLSKLIKQASDIIDDFVLKLVFLSIFGIIVSITLQICFRIFFDSLTWTEELSRYLLVWSTFLGATLAYKRGLHISVTFCVNAFKPVIKKSIIILSIILSMVFFGVVIISGFEYLSMQSAQVSPALRLPMSWVYIVIPGSFLIMGIHGISSIFEEIYNTGEGNLQ